MMTTGTLARRGLLALAAAAAGPALAASTVFGVDDVTVTAAEPRVRQATAWTDCCIVCEEQNLEALTPTPAGPLRLDQGQLPLRQKFCGRVTRYGVKDETADPRDIMLNMAPLAGGRYDSFVAGFYNTEETPLSGDRLEYAFNRNHCDVAACLSEARPENRPGRVIHAEVTPPDEFYGVDGRFLSIAADGGCSDSWDHCESELEPSSSGPGLDVCVYGVYAIDHGGDHGASSHTNLCCSPDPSHDRPEIHPIDGLWWRHPEQDGWIFAVLQDDSNRYSYPHCDDDHNGNEWSQAPRDLTFRFPFRFTLDEGPRRARLRRFVTPPLSEGPALAVVPLNVTTAAVTAGQPEVKSLSVGGQVVFEVLEESAAASETWVRVEGGLVANPGGPDTLAGTVVVRVAVGCSARAGMDCRPDVVRALAPGARVADGDIGSGFYYGEISWERAPRPCTAERAAVDAARARREDLRWELIDLQAQLAEATSPIVRANLRVRIAYMRDVLIPQANAAIAAAEAALAACLAS